jgi:hypothetical protein
VGARVGRPALLDLQRPAATWSSSASAAPHALRTTHYAQYGLTPNWQLAAANKSNCKNTATGNPEPLQPQLKLKPKPKPK